MAYSTKIEEIEEVVKEEIKERLQRGETAEEISKKMGISLSVVHNRQQKETSKEINRLLELRKFAKAIRLTEKYPNDMVIQSQRIKILMEKGRIEEAKKIGERFPDNEVIQSQMVTVAIQEGRIEEAKEIGVRFPDNEVIQSQMVTIIKNEMGIETREIAEIILKEQKNYINQEEVVDNRSNSLKNFIQTIREKLYYGEITDEDIDKINSNTEMSEYDKTCVLLAIYEKEKDVLMARQTVKKFQKENPEQKDNNKTLNLIMQRIESKRKPIFDHKFYDKLIKWSTDNEMKEDNQNSFIDILKGLTDVQPTVKEPNYYNEIITFLKTEENKANLKLKSKNEYSKSQGNKVIEKIRELQDMLKEVEGNNEALKGLYEQITSYIGRIKEISKDDKSFDEEDVPF